MREIIAAGLVVVLAGCGDRSAHAPVTEIAVVWVAGNPLPDAPGLETADAVAEDLPGVALSLYGVATPLDGARLVHTLGIRGDSLIVCLGRPMLEILRAEPGRSPGLLWLGFDDPGLADGRLLAWWAPAESLRIEVARRAAETSTSLMVVGSCASAGILRALRDSGARIRPVAVDGVPARGVLPSPGESILMLDEAPIPPGIRDAVYWACESPFAAPRAGRLTLRMDWAHAMGAAIRWHLGRGGVPPGPTLGPWLAIQEGTGEVS